MEEITIPHTCAPPPPVGEARIRVADLDEVARLAFKGVEYLNRIQSIVFDAAYTTNENLLISAPTGAGKTNIAMLAVLHEVKNNIDHMGVLRRNQFKVCYPFFFLGGGGSNLLWCCVLLWGVTSIS